MSPRVLFVDQSAELGGGELCLLDLTTRRGNNSKVLLFANGPFRDRLCEASVPVEVITTGSTLANVRRGSGLRNIAASLPALVGLAKRIAVQTGDFDMLYANSQKAFMLAGLVSKLCGRPLIWHLHDILSPSHFSWMNRMGAAQMANVSARRIIVNSSATAAAFHDAGGRDDKVRVIHNGIDPTPFDAVDGTAAKQQLRSELGCGNDAVLVGNFSRLAEWKGQHVLLEALAALPSVHAVLVGGGLFGESAYEERLRQMAKQAGLSARIHFLGFRNDIPALMKAVDIIVHTAVAPEPFGRVVVEGMLSENPVIAAGDGGVVEIIENGVDGLLVPPGNVEALAAAIRRLISDPALAKQLAAKGRTTAERRFSMEASSAAVEAVIAELAHERSRSPIWRLRKAT